jgi:hypothetical protein
VWRRTQADVLKFIVMRLPAARDLVLNAGGTYRFIGRELAADTIAWEYDTFARAEALFVHFAQRPPGTATRRTESVSWSPA